jgi:hypothetical protein
MVQGCMGTYGDFVIECLETESRHKLNLEVSPNPTGTQRRIKYLETESRDKLKLVVSPKPIGTQR